MRTGNRHGFGSMEQLVAFLEKQVEIGAVTIAGMSGRDLAVARRYVYIAGRDAGPTVDDVSQPEAPRMVGKFEMPPLLMTH